jgi:glyoxylase-like metal-dependent hydrolase (beta-lactamase superfamily II)
MTFANSVLTTWLLLLGLTVAAEAQPGTIKRIAPGVWFREGEMQLSGHCHNIIIEMKDYLIVVDANYPSGAKLVIGDVKKLSSKPIKYVIDTHAHSDHAYGNALFTRMGAITIAHAGVAEEMKLFEPQAWRQTASYRKDVAELNLPGPEPPRQTYTKSPYVIRDSTRRVELHHFGWGHTRGDTFVYLPKENILCTGDAVGNGAYSDPKHAYMGNWANEVRAARKLKIVHVLPGHGDPGGKELLDGQIQFLDELYHAVQAAVKEGKTLDQLVTMENGRPVATSIRLSERMMDVYVNHGPGLKPWQVMRLPTQVKNTYEEITQRKPYGDIAAGK